MQKSLCLFSEGAGNLRTPVRFHGREDEVCPFVHGVESSDDAGVYIENNYTTLFPGEKEHFIIAPIYLPAEIGNDELAYIWDYFNNPKAGA